MNRIISALAAIALVAGGACASSKGIGKDLEGLGSSEIASPTPTPSKRAAKPTKKAPPKTVKPPEGYKGRTYEIKIKSSAEGYDPRERRLYVGDTIVFTNLDTVSEHSFTADNGAWDSGKLKAGEKFTYKVTVAPGQYTFHCEVVPYVLGGPIDVLAAPK